MLVSVLWAFLNWRLRKLLGLFKVYGLKSRHPVMLCEIRSPLLTMLYVFLEKHLAAQCGPLAGFVSNKHTHWLFVYSGCWPTLLGRYNLEAWCNHRNEVIKQSGRTLARITTRWNTSSVTEGQGTEKYLEIRLIILPPENAGRIFWKAKLNDIRRGSFFLKEAKHLRI